MGIAAIATLPLYLLSFDWMASLLDALDGHRQRLPALLGRPLRDRAAVMLPATFCAGMTLPLITRMLLAGGTGERAIGAVYGVNTLGSIVGAAVAALVLDARCSGSSGCSSPAR